MEFVKLLHVHRYSADICSYSGPSGILTCCLLLLPLWDSVIILCFAVRFSFAIIWMGKREFVDLLSLSSWCLVIVYVALPRDAMG